MMRKLQNFRWVALFPPVALFFRHWSWCWGRYDVRYIGTWLGMFMFFRSNAKWFGTSIYILINSI
jgi:hypothetical protein